MLPAEQRLRRNRDFRRAYGRGRSYANSFAVLYVLRRSPQEAEGLSGRRIGFVVSKKQGKAVVRNRIKRRLREILRLRLPHIPDGPCDLVFVARGRLKTASHNEIEGALDDLFRRSGLLRASSPGSAAVPRNRTAENAESAAVSADP